MIKYIKMLNFSSFLKSIKMLIIKNAFTVFFTILCEFHAHVKIGIFLILFLPLATYNKF